MSIKHVLKFVFLSVSVLNWSLFAGSQPTNSIRAAIDIGSGGPKLRVAEVNLVTNKIEKIIHIKKYFVPFVASLSQSESNAFSPEIMEQGLAAFQDAVAVAKSFGSCGIVAIATSSFRAASNGEQFADSLQKATGVNVHIVDQQLEGELAFQAARAQIEIDPENLVIWDIGSSMQFVGLAEDGSTTVDGSNVGSWFFMNHIIEDIQGRPSNAFRSPNPLSVYDIDQAEYSAKVLATCVNQLFKDKIAKPSTEVIGVGSVFGNGIAELLTHKNPFTRDELAKIVEALAGKTDDDLGGGDYACVEASNAILALGFMQTLNIQQMRIVDVNNADGALVYESFWQ